jgi:HSP20 family molecular chaperone IbpA
MAIGSWMPFRRGEQNMPARRGNGSERGGGMTRMQDEMNRMMEQFFGNSLMGGMPSQFFGDFSSQQFVPRMDISESGNMLKVSAELPGMSADDVEISVRNNRMHIRGEKRHEETQEDEGYYRAERSFGAFERTIPLPEDVDADKADASFKNGVLTVQVPMIEGKMAGKKVEIKGD